MQGLNQKELNCVGERCPAPILKIAKAARSLGAAGGGMLDVSADDPAFVMDLKSWCVSSKAELVELVDDGGVHRARVRVAPRTAGGTVVSLNGGQIANPPGAPPRTQMPPARTGQTAVGPAPAANRAPAEELDYRGMQCPAPILQLSKRARQLGPGQNVVVICDDPAFPLDVKSWCRSAGAELVSMEESGGAHRARIQLGGRAAATPPPAPSNNLPVAAAPATPAVVPAGTTVDLRGLDQGMWRALLDQAHRNAQAGDRITVMGDSPSLSQIVLNWCNDTANAFLKFDASGPITAELQITTPYVQTTALAVPAPDNRCTLLVLHNDHEALLAALLVAVGAASQGKDVTIFFTFWGLNLLRGEQPNPNEKGEKISFMQKMMKWMMPKGPKKQKLGQMNFGGAGKAMLGHIMRSQNLMELPALIETAEEQGVRFIACTMSMEVMGITKRDLAPRTNLEYGGVAAFVEAAHGSGMSLVF